MSTDPGGLLFLVVSNSTLRSRFPWVTFTKVLIVFISLSYLAYLTVGLFLGYLGPNPVEVVTHKTGEWGLYYLLATLAITPLRRHFHWNQLQRFRRFLGLWSFAFIFLHLAIFLVFDHFFDLYSIIDDIVERPYIAVGFAAFLLMLPLAITSLKSLQKAMGKHWLVLHRSVYCVAILAIIHYWWLVKADILWPAIYGSVLCVLLGDRIFLSYRKRQRI